MKERFSSGEFWADAIKGLRSKPAARFRMAQGNMPLPAAFREAAIALRAMIRDRRKEGEEYADLLRLLYVTAAQEDFLLHTPYIDGIGPAYNVAERIPKKVWTGLEYPYQRIGYRHLHLLTKTDIKWIVEGWGKPIEHNSAQEFHHAIWLDYVVRTRRAFLKSDRRFEREMNHALGIGSGGSGGSTPEAKPISLVTKVLKFFGFK